MLERSKGRRGVPTEAEAIAAKLFEKTDERGEAVSKGKAIAKQRKADLLRPRKWVPPEERDKD